LAIAVPIIIHLINRMQFRRVRWAAMEFLLAAQKRMRQRLLIEQLLLLLLRILLMLLLGLLLSRWLVSGTPPAPAVDLVLHEVLLDDSMSMSDREPAQGEERPAFQSARDESVRLAKNLEKSRLPCRLRIRLASNPDNPLFDQMITDGSNNELQQILAKSSQLVLVIASAVDQQDHTDVAGRKTIDQTGQQLQFKILHQDRITEHKEATRRVLFVFLKRLVQRDFRQDFVELLNQSLGVGRRAKLDVAFALGAQALFEQVAVVVQHAIVVTQHREVDTAFGQ
jgi:hypothetical protein